MSEGMLTAQDVAAQLEIGVDSWRAYVTRGYAPKPDGHFGRTPWWSQATIDTWKASRPGQGAGGGRPRKMSGS